MTSRNVNSPSLPSAQLGEVWSILRGGVDSLGLNDFGNPWPSPRGDVIARALAHHDADLCIRAAREAREIVQAQDRAPNITGLFEKKLRDLATQQAYESQVRETVRSSLAVGGGEA